MVGRVLHILTLGAYAWDLSSDPTSNGAVEALGVNSGTIFSQNKTVPTQRDWVEGVFLSSPDALLMSKQYHGEETMIELIDRLAREGGARHFRVEDEAIRAGATWLCEYVIRISPKAAVSIGRQSNDNRNSEESDLQRRKREAQDRHMKLMQEKMAKFMKAMGQIETDDHVSSEAATNEGDNDQNVSSCHILDNSISKKSSCSDEKPSERQKVQNCLQCVICGSGNIVSKHKEGNQDSGKEEHVLALCGFIQSSVVLKGGCSKDGDSFVGSHISMCGHAVHTSCCEAHMKDVANRVGRQFDSLERGKRAEFRCPLCR